MAALTTAARKHEIALARSKYLAEASGLEFAHVLLIEHFDPVPMSDWSLVESLPPSWDTLYTLALNQYFAMLEFRLAVAKLAEARGTDNPFVALAD